MMDKETELDMQQQLQQKYPTYIKAEENRDLISLTTDILKEKLEEEPYNLSVKDIISIREQAYKQENIHKGVEIDSKHIIPAVINIQINNN